MTKPYWIDGPWNGRLGVSPRPRGGDWLEDEIREWHREGIDSVISMLTSAEEAEMGLSEEAAITLHEGLHFFPIPVPDRGIPDSSPSLLHTLDLLAAELASGRNIVVHCRQGIGRSGLIAAALLISAGISVDEAIRRVSLSRGVPVPETAEQERWIESFAASLLGNR